MCFHIIQAFVQASKHIGKVGPPYSIPSPWSIEPSRRGIQQVIILQVLFDLSRKLQVTSLGRQESLAFLLEIGCLRFNRFERFGKATQGVEGG